MAGAQHLTGGRGTVVCDRIRPLPTPAITPMLMFEGQAEEAMGFYCEVFDDAEIVAVERHPEGDPGAGTVLHAEFRLGSQRLRCIDSAVEHPFSFTPAVSLVADCESEAEVDDLCARLGADGEVLMPADAYPFARRFGWIVDRFGVSWQLRAA